MAVLSPRARPGTVLSPEDGCAGRRARGKRRKTREGAPGQGQRTGPDSVVDRDEGGRWSLLLLSRTPLLRWN
jgi:hypothetical protein